MSSKEARKVHADSQKKRNMSEWFSLFADLDPLANPDAIGISTKESDPNCYSWEASVYILLASIFREMTHGANVKKQIIE